LDVDTGSFLNESTLLIEFGGLLPLFHLLTDTGNINNNIFIVNVLCNTETSLDITHFDGCSCDTTVALSIMLLVINLVILFLLLGKESLLVKLLCFNGVALVFDLRGQLSANELFFVLSNLFGKFEGLEPVLKIHSHFEGKLWLG
jgi:hypothetical protein